ncbi:FliM/FliN family flagellar motor switch protein [Clostridium culturomicium]|uniref:FliM/FliN family flagellar motor switch protein n=1 Tax=Clostridium culturomicium TaxID=1499683 RepID=UPI00058BE18F|nr:FliM/FliN family flagellar motor C-terminal domain-containing protein [Clostridium culturomicium]
MEPGLKEKLYEVEFESFKIKEIEEFNDKSAILNAKLEVSVTMGSCKTSIKDILDLKTGDIIVLDKTMDEDLDININSKTVALGEPIKVDDKISVRLLDFKNKID